MAESRRSIRSFVLRQGRLTASQKKALRDYWPIYGLSTEDGLLDIAGGFPRKQTPDKQPLTLEIGFGMGGSLVSQARDNPERNFIGVEVHRPGVMRLLMEVANNDLHNLRVYAEDSIRVLEESIPDSSLNAIQLFFPDPWPKKRHHKRRIINRQFLALIKPKLQPAGIIHITTDWKPYAEEIIALFAADAMFTAVAPPARPGTKFEQRGLRLGHDISDLAYRLQKQQARRSETN